MFEIFFGGGYFFERFLKKISKKFVVKIPLPLKKNSKKLPHPPPRKKFSEIFLKKFPPPTPKNFSIIFRNNTPSPLRKKFRKFFQIFSKKNFLKFFEKISRKNFLESFQKFFEKILKNF